MPRKKKRPYSLGALIAPADDQPSVRHDSERINPPFRPLVPTPLSEIATTNFLANVPTYTAPVLDPVSGEQLRPTGPNDYAIHVAVEFDETVRLATKYVAMVANEGFVPIVHDYAQEAEHRLEQLNFLLKSVCVQQQVHLMHFDSPEKLGYEVNVDPVTGASSISDPNHYHDYNSEHARFLVEVYTEAFYYSAHRLQTVLKNGLAYLPFITDYSDAVGVRTVRNLLIEHPEGSNSGITERRWAYHSQRGPMVKAARRPDQPRHTMDLGMFVNAYELKNKVTQVYKRAFDNWDDEVVRQARTRFKSLKERVVAQDLEIELDAYSLQAYIEVSPRIAEMAQYLEHLGLSVGLVGDLPRDLKMVEVADISSLAELDGVLAASEPWGRSFLRTVYENSGGLNTGTDRDAIFKFLLIASLPEVFTDEVLSKELDFPQPERFKLWRRIG